MGMSAAAGVAWSGGITAGTSIIAGLLNLYSTAQTNKQNLRIYEDQTARDTVTERANRKQTQQQIDLNTRQQDFNEQDTMYNRGVVQEKTNYDRAKDQYNEAIKTLSTKASLNQVRLAPFTK